MAAKKSPFSYFAFWPMFAGWVLGNIRFVLLIALLGVIYIAFSREAEYNVRKIQVLKKDVRKLRWEYMSLQSELMYTSTQSQIIKTMEAKGYTVDKKGPQRIIVPKGSIKLND
ncbi:MAG TPA: hypothetical protein ENK85_02340 [Saprospiraceae bacterium]|nr:hypothetical protein [Saprospiraceae bacterium]